MATTRMQDINDELTALISTEKKSKIVDIDEDVFKHRLLPLAVARYSNVDYEIELTHWQAVTGESPYHGVRVIRNGMPLYTTPPLILTPKVSFDGASLLDNLKDAEKREKSGLPAGDIMDEEKLKPSLSITSLSQALNTWVYIFRLYGIKLIPLSPDGTPTEEPKVAKVLPDTTSPSDSWEDDDDGDIL